MAATNFEELDAQLAAGGPDAVLNRLVENLQTEKKYHELFDARLMQSRRKLGLPAVLTTSIDELPEPTRTKVEDAYLEACREVGGLLLKQGQLREAWMYLRPTGDKSTIAAALNALEPDEDNIQEIIELGLHEGVAPILGYQMLLDSYGTCNAITTYESVIASRPKADQQAAASLLVRRLHEDLIESVRADIERQEGTKPPEATLEKLVADREWLFLENNYHVDTTHLASIVRFARIVEDQDVLRLALDLTHYGRHLDQQFQFAGDEPFVDMYPTHGLFFSALLGERVDEALAYFRERATSLSIDDHGPIPAEIFISLLARVGRPLEAVEATAELLPPGTRLSGLAPSLLELSRLAGSYDRLKQVCQARGDLLGYTAGLIDAKK